MGNIEKSVVIETLTKDDVVITLNEVYKDGDTEFAKLPHTISYINSLDGRSRMLSEQPAYIANAIMSMWGETPTVQYTEQ